MQSPVRLSKLLLVSGDLACFVLALWLSLAVRALSVPSASLFAAHIIAFLPLFIVWLIVFFIAGLYEERRILFGTRTIGSALLYAQIANIIIAALFFFFIPTFGIAPKTVLIIYLAISFSLILLWRSRWYPTLGLERSERAVVIGSGGEIEELIRALNQSRFSPVRVAEAIAPEGPLLGAAVGQAIDAHQPQFIIADFELPQIAQALPELYNLLSRGIRFVDAAELYEDVFGRVLLSRVSVGWIASNVSLFSHFLYDPLKRAMDIALALPAAIVSLALYPFIAAVIKWQDGGPVFYRQARVGAHERPLIMVKFRSMTGADQGAEVLRSKLAVTPLGRFLRRTRLDELPQLWSVVKGDLSLIGPRPEFPALVAQYTANIPFYGIRHLVRPGLSGWAQIYHDNHPHHGEAVEATREKLSYDLYYLKHRSLLLDLIIAMKTIAKLFTRSGV